MKQSAITIRISERDKEELRKQAEEMQMTMSQYVLYLVHKEEAKKEQKMGPT